MAKRSAIICDLDGTLYDARERQQKHLLSGKKDFDAFHQDAENDQPHIWCKKILLGMQLAYGSRIIFSSGRDDTYRKQTQSWLGRHLGLLAHEYDLYMRAAGDYTADDVMKEGWISLILEKYDILFAIDDRKRVADMWRRNGIVCLHCDEGNF